MNALYKHVSKCDCCDTLLTRVAVPYMHVSNCAVLANNAQKLLGGYGFKGDLSLQCAGSVITNFYYQYSNQDELTQSQLLYDLLSELANEYFDSLSDAGIDWTYHPITL